MALIGESLLTAVLEVLVDRLASPEVLGYFKTQKLDDGLLEKLKGTLNTVNGLLEDAEEKQITKPAVKNWLNDVKHAVYEAEDLLDEIDYEHQRYKDETASQPAKSLGSTHVGKFLQFLNPANKRMNEMKTELEKIFERLERLVKHKGDLRYIEGTIGGRPVPEKTIPLVNESHVYGRETDRKAIMELLTRNQENGPNVAVIPIVGMGGIGKTTLAQVIYNDSRVEDCFQLKAWVWASERFDATRVMNEILKKINASTGGAKEPEESLKDALKEKTFFFVLDDVWNIEYNEWDKLLLPLQYTKQVKIVVTTRDEGAVKVMQTVIPPYPLKVISDEDCWQLFARHAFSGINSDALSQLQEFGREIVGKCKGLPLAVKTIGGVLHSKGDVKEWEKISKSSLWGLSNENIPPALRLSYYYLPSHLKRCFAFCAIFPKGYIFQKERLISLWMAGGFLIPSIGKEMEEVGDAYFNDLVSRSLLQQATKYDSSIFSMHDLINDLAEYVSGEFCFKFKGDGESGFGLEDENSFTHSERIRYLSFGSRYGCVPKIFDHIQKVQHLRMVLSVPCYRKKHTPFSEVPDIFTILKRLRMLSLAGHDIDMLPDSICNLKHLRHLDLTSTKIVRLPENVSNLYNLQTLILALCQQLIALPTNMSKLINLQHLDIQGTGLKEMPSEMGKLKKLRKLTDFFLGKQSGSSIKELGKLLHLRGSLRIWNLQNVVAVQDALDANLKGKEQIDCLELNWGGLRFDAERETDDTQREREVLEKLEPCVNLKKLWIIGYGGTRFPNWVGNSSFSNMVRLDLRGCKNCTSLPPLGQLPSLEDLHIEGFDEVVAVGLEFYGSVHPMEKPFKSLKKLKVEKMPQWKEWKTDVPGAFPLIEYLRMVACPKLVCSFPAAPKLTQFNFNGNLYICRQYEVSYDRWGLLGSYPLEERWLVVREGSLLKGIKRASGIFSSITRVTFRGCSSLKSCQLDFLPHFSKFTIQNCPDLESLCISEGPLPSLRELVVTDCPNLKSLLENLHSLLPSLERLELESLPQLDSFLEGGLPSNLNSLRIRDSMKLNVLSPCLPSLLSLSRFFFGGDDDVESFPAETLLLPSTLTYLEICDLRNLNSLDNKGLQHLTFLRNLSIDGCIKLEFIPEESLPSSIEHLEIKSVKDLDCKGLQHLTSLRQLQIRGCPKLESLPEEGLPSSLAYLEIGDLENLKSLSCKGLQHLNSIRHLKIWKCPKLESLPEEGLPSSLKGLEIEDMENLKSLNCKGLQHLTSIRHLKIWKCPKLESLPEEGLPSSLEYLEIVDLENLKSLNCKGLQHLTSIRHLKIWKCPKLESLPEEGLPSSLEYLEIEDLENLKSLNCKGLQHLNSIRHLKIWKCPKLESMPEEGLPSSLQ